MKSFLPKFAAVPALAAANWKSGLTVALISVPLSIALSIAAGAGPIPGIITGVWATLIASFFGSNNYNVIGAAGALSTILFAATLSAPLGLGAAALPLIAMATGVVILIVWALNADRFLYYVPECVMYGFATGVAIAIAAGELFDATGLSFMKRTGSFLGDIQLYVQHAAETHTTALIVFGIFLAGILLWKRFIKKLPAVIPAAVLGVLFGWLDSTYFHLDLVSLAEKFGGIKGAIFAPVHFDAIPTLLASGDALTWLLTTAGTVALVGILETLITAKLADRLTRTQSSSRRELFGLALANIGSGVMGGLPATGVFIRTGANIKAGATHRMSSTIAAIATALIALIVLPSFGYIPMAVIAAILVNTALGLIETHKFIEYWKHERASFVIALIVTVVTILVDAGTGVVVGAIASLLLFADSVSHGRFDAVFNFTDGSKEEVHGKKDLHLPEDTQIAILTYSIAGTVSYIDAERHATNLRQAVRSEDVASVIVRLRGLVGMDLEGATMLADAAKEFQRIGKPFYFSAASAPMEARIRSTPAFAALTDTDLFVPKTSVGLERLRAAA